MGVVGLGVGTLAARGQPGDHIRFFELSPLVIEYAQRYFTFLEDSEATVEIVPGDARLSLERELAGAGSVGRYDLLFVDAFSGDSIPTHLLTEESFRLYRDALADDGALVVHVTNQHLDLGPVVRALAGLIGYSAVEIRQEADERRSIRENRWIVCASDPAFVAELVPFASREASGPAPVIWTDAFSPLLPVIKWQ